MQITAEGENLDQLDEAPGTGPVSDVLFYAFHAALGKGFRVPPSRMPGSGGAPIADADYFDPLDLTPAFMDSVMALTYTDCDADPAASPAGSKPGQHFDAKGSDGKNRHYYCTRGTYTPATPGSGVGPAWHRFQN